MKVETRDDNEARLFEVHKKIIWFADIQCPSSTLHSHNDSKNHQFVPVS